MEKIIVFEISGKFAHFRNYYTNSSNSLSYKMIPYTTVWGILASILKMERHSYYKLFSEKLKISMKIKKGSEIRSLMQSVNNIHPSYYDFLTKDTRIPTSRVTQCNMEVLTGNIAYTIFVGGDIELVTKIENKIKDRDYGYGVALGLQSFLADINFINSYEKKDIKYLKKSNKLDSVYNSSFVWNTEKTQDIITEKVTKNFKTFNKGGRLPTEYVTLYFEREGNPLYGKFENIYQLKNDYNIKVI